MSGCLDVFILVRFYTQNEGKLFN